MVRSLAIDCVRLVKPGLCFFLGLSALFGHVVAAGFFSIQSVITGAGVLILSCGSAVLNNIQDRDFDRSFQRTCNRILAKRKMPVPWAVFLCLGLIISGLGILWRTESLTPVLLGVTGLVFYNGIYTPVKKYSLLAMVPGTAAGMMAPLIGWCAAGGHIVSHKAFIIAGIWGLWQFPHFLTLLLMYKEKTAESGQGICYPSFFHIFSKSEMQLQVLIWFSLYSLCMLLFLISGGIQTPFFSIPAAVHAVAGPCLLTLFMYRSKSAGSSRAFAYLNISIFLFMTAAIADHLVIV